MCKIDSDKIFSDRKKINSILDKLDHDTITFSDVEKAIEKLSKFETKQLTEILVKRLSGSDNDFYVANYVLRELANESIVPNIIEMVFDKAVPDEKKAILISLLDEMNVDIENINFNEAFDDIDKMGRMAVESLINEIGNNHVTLDKAVSWLYEIPEDARMSFIDSICQVDNEKSYSFLQKILIGDDTELIKRILLNFSKSNNPFALKTINDAIPYVTNQELKNMMERSARKMTFKGISEPEQKTKSVKFGEIYKILTTNIDGVGSQSLWIARNSGRKLECMFLLINEKLGIKDCFGNQMSKKEFDAMVEHQFSGGVTTIEIPYEKAINLIKDGMYINQTEKTLISPSFHFLRANIIEEQNLYPEKYNPQFKGYDLDDIKADKDLIELTELVLELVPECESWFIVNSYVYDIAESLLEKTDNQEVVVPSRKKLKEVAGKIVSELIPQLKRRLLITADLLNCHLPDVVRKKKDKELKNKIEILLCAALNIDKKVENNNFLLSIAEDSLYQAQISLINGFDFRKRPEFFE